MQQQTNTQQLQNLEKKFFNQNEKPKDVRKSNILAAKGKYYDYNEINSCGRCH